MAVTDLRRMLGASALACVTVLASTVMAPAAHAAGKKWGPIYAKTDGTSAAAAWGDFANNGGVYATVGANWTDLKYTDGWDAYVEVQFTFWKQGRWQYASTVQSKRTYDTASGPLSARLRSDATAARAVIKVCVDRSARPDVCSPTSIVSFNY